MTSPDRGQRYEPRPTALPQHPLGHIALPPELVFDRNEPDWDEIVSHRTPASQPLLRSESQEMWGGSVTSRKKLLRSRASLLLCRSQTDVPSLNAFATERQFKAEKQQVKEKLSSLDAFVMEQFKVERQQQKEKIPSLDPFVMEQFKVERRQVKEKLPSLDAFVMERQQKAEMREIQQKVINSLTQHSLLQREKQATRNGKATRIEKSVRPGTHSKRSTTVVDVNDDDDDHDKISTLREDAMMMPPSNRGCAPVNGRRAQGGLGLKKSRRRAAPSIAVIEVDDIDDDISFLTEEVMMATSNRVFDLMNGRRADPIGLQSCLGLAISGRRAASFLRTIAVIEEEDEDTTISEEVMTCPSNRGDAPVNDSCSDLTGFHGFLGLSLYPLTCGPTPPRKIGTSGLNAESPTSVMVGANYPRFAEVPGWEDPDLELMAFQREVKALKRWKAGKRSFTGQPRKCVRFAHPIVTSQKNRPFTEPEDLPLLFFDQDDLEQLETDRNNSIPEEEFECVATPAGKKVSVSFPRRLSRKEVQQRQLDTVHM